MIIPLNIKKENLDAILKGMRGVTSEVGGTAYYVFSDLGIEIGGKTGSAETGINNQVNGWFAGFAPYDNPEISVASAITTAGTGTSTAEITAAVIDYYYNQNNQEEKAQTDATLLL